MRKIFLDIGMHRGQTLKKAIEEFPNLDLYIGVEPVKELVLAAEKLLWGSDKVRLYCIALDMFDGDIIKDRKITFYEDMSKGNRKLGSSILADKTMRKQRAISVTAVDVRTFFKKVFLPDDKVIMKSDVEGKEYDIFEALIESGLLQKYVIKIFAEWHWHKVPSIPKSRHNEILIALNKLGYNLKGKSELDEFYNGF